MLNAKKIHFARARLVLQKSKAKKETIVPTEIRTKIKADSLKVSSRSLKVFICPFDPNVG